jgi:sugar phosphate isomerase/epimerase
MNPNLNRRHFVASLGLMSAGLATGIANPGAVAPKTFRLRYILASAMFGKLPLEVILPEVAKTGSEAIDIWGLPHGDQREQVDRMGVEAFAALLAKHKVRMGVSTRYPLGPFGLRPEMDIVKHLGGQIVLCGTSGAREPKGGEARTAVRAFLEKMKPHVAHAEERGLTIALENHDRQLLYHPDSLRYFAHYNGSKHLGLALALHHLHDFETEIPKLIEDLGNDQIPFLYFQEYSEGIRHKVPKEEEMKQLPGFGGGLDYRPIIRSLRKIGYSGYAEIFMHPTPRGIPILPTVEAITGAINKSRAYLERCLDETA